MEKDIKFLTEDYNKLVEGNDSVLNSVMSETADIKIRIESNLLTKKYLKEAGEQLGNKMKIYSSFPYNFFFIFSGKNWECYRRSVDSALDDFSALEPSN